MLTHDELVAASVKWLKGSCGCGVALGEHRAQTSTGERPDAIGFRADYSILVEAKTSRSDFLADKKKWFKKEEKLGMGTFRFYCCEPGVIQPEDLPRPWGLIYCVNGRMKKIICPTGNIWLSQKSFICERNTACEITMLVSALRQAG